MLRAAEQLPLAPLLSAMPDETRRAINRAAEMEFRFVQLSATQAGMRPRELDQSARRDLLAVLRRHELSLAGLDLWIPVEHFRDEAQISRAVDATVDAIVLASDLGHVPVSMNLPKSEEAGSDVLAALDAISNAALQNGITIANHATPTQTDIERGFGVGIDPAAHLAQGLDPAAAIVSPGSHVVSARLCDLNASGIRCSIGEAGGRLDIAGYAIALSVAGYQRPVVIDARQWIHPWYGVQRTADAWAMSMGVR